MLITTFRLDLDALALSTAFRKVPGMGVEAERIAAHSTEWTMPCLWIAANDFDAVDEALSADSSVDRIIESDEFGAEKFYNIDWDDAVDRRITEYIDTAGSILSAKATQDGWEVRFRFTSREQFDTFRAMIDERGHSFELLDLFEPGAPRQTEGGVTPRQREALVTAVECGYFAVPREASAQDLADELGMSSQSVSELLRRGTESLVQTTLMTEPGRLDQR